MPEQATTAVKTITVDSEKKPYMLRLVGPTMPVLQQAAVHIRSGYVFSKDLPVEFFGPTGRCAITLNLGQPETYAVGAAEATLAEAIAAESVERQKEIEEAAKRMIEEAARAEKQAKIAAEIAEQEASLRKLKQSLAAA